MRETAFSARESGPERRVELSPDGAVVLPLRMRMTCAVAMFRVPTREARKLVPSQRLVPTELYPGTTLVGLAVAEVHHAEGLARHGTLGILVPVRYRPRLSVPFLPLVAPKQFEDAGYYVHRMATTSAAVQAVHTSVLGSASSLAEMRFDEEPFWRSCAVHVAGVPLLSLEVKKARARALDVTTHLYSMHEGNLLRTPLPLRGEFGFARGPQSGRLTLGKHYVADELRGLGLADAPACTFHGPQIETLFAAPDRVLSP